MTPKIKICGNTNVDDVKLVREAGADFVGFIFAESKRKISVEQVEAIIKEVGAFDGYVGVFANQPKEEVEKIAGRLKLRWLQFHGDETSRYCQYFQDRGIQVIKTFRIKDALSLKRIAEYNVTAFLFDAYSKEQFGGTGVSFDWSILEKIPYAREKLFLAGGLSIYNLREAIDKVKPYAVDVASGVEKTPGIKDPELVRQFIEIAKGKVLQK